MRTVRTVLMEKHNAPDIIFTVELISDKTRQIAKPKGAGNYVMRWPSGTYSRVKSIIPFYKMFKEHGYKVDIIY